MRRALRPRATGIRSTVAGMVALSASVLGLAEILLGYACGGTTGHGPVDLSAPSVGSDAGADATVGSTGAQDASSGAFDVAIQYVDQILPEVNAPSAPVMDASTWPWPWPECPPFIPVNADGTYNDSGTEQNQIPAAYGANGDVIPAPDGSACATYPWLGSPASDTCVVYNGLGSGALLPPCNWCMEAGVATGGPGAANAQPLYSLCLTLYGCMVNSGCSYASRAFCLCGDAGPTESCEQNPTGPCAQEELAATNTDNTPQGLSSLLENYENIDPGADNPAFCGSFLNQLYQFGKSRSNPCFDAGP